MPVMVSAATSVSEMFPLVLFVALKPVTTLLPFVSVDEKWRNAVEVSRVDPATPDGRAGVRIRFADGREIATNEHMLGGGSEGQLFELAKTWWKAAR